MEKEQEKAAKAREAALQGALTQIERSSGRARSCGWATRARRCTSHAIPTGALSLDLALGIGGVPRGRIVEVFGPESSGKTTLIYHVLAEAQKLGGICAFIDAEHAMDPLYAKRIGVDIDELLVSQPDYGEQALEIADMLVRSGAVDVVAIDSVAALTPRPSSRAQMGDQTVGLQARMMSQAMRKLAGNLNRTKTLCIFTNQIREKVGVMFGSPETQPGGRALKFYSSQRLDIRRIETLKEGTEAVGNRVRVKVVKNKVAAPVPPGRVRHRVRQGHLHRGLHPRPRASSTTSSRSRARSSPTATSGSARGATTPRRYLREHPRDRQGDRGARSTRRSASIRLRRRARSSRRRCGGRARRGAAAADAAGPMPDRGAGRLGRGARGPPGRPSSEHALDLAYRALGHRDRTVAEVRDAAWSASASSPRRSTTPSRSSSQPATSTTPATRGASPRTGARSSGWGAERIERDLLAARDRAAS